MSENFNFENLLANADSFVAQMNEKISSINTTVSDMCSTGSGYIDQFVGKFSEMDGSIGFVSETVATLGGGMTGNLQIVQDSIANMCTLAQEQLGLFKGSMDNISLGIENIATSSGDFAVSLQENTALINESLNNMVTSGDGSLTNFLTGFDGLTNGISGLTSSAATYAGDLGTNLTTIGDTISGLCTDSESDLGRFVGGIGNFVSNVGGFATEAAGFFGKVSEGITTLQNLKDMFVQLTEQTWFQDAAMKALNITKEIFNGIQEKGLLVWAKETAATIADKVAKLAHNVATAAVTAAQTALNFVMNLNPIMLVVLAVGALIAVFVLLWNKCEGFRNFFTSMINMMVKGINGLLTILLMPFNLIIKGLNLIPGVNIPEIRLQIPSIPQLATGGVISSPTVAMIGEAGKEAVVPLENNTGWMDKLAATLYNLMSSNNSTQTYSQAAPAVLNIDGKEMARILLPLLNAEQRQVSSDLNIAMVRG